MLGNSVRLFRVFGIDIGVHASWLIIFALLTWSLAVGWFPQWPGLERSSEGEYWLLGAISAVLLFGAVIVHELAHSLVAKARGLDVHSITLFLFGGVSNLTGEAKRPSTEFAIAIVGPLTSFGIAAVVYLATALVAFGPQLDAVLWYLVLINVALGAFNLLPGFPLDGGRVLRALAWNWTGSLRRGTEIAAFGGQLVAWGLLAYGAYRILVFGDLFGIWIGAIGWFLQNAANAGLQQVLVEQRLRGLRVADVVEPDTTVVAPDLPIATLVDDYFLRGNRRAVPVVAADGRLAGMVTIGDVKDVPKERWATTRVADVMGGRDGVVSVGSRDTLQKALEALSQGDFEQVPVVDAGMLVGVVTRADVVRQIQLREALGLEGAAPRATGEGAA